MLYAKRKKPLSSAVRRTNSKKAARYRARTKSTVVPRSLARSVARAQMEANEVRKPNCRLARYWREIAVKVVEKSASMGAAKHVKRA